MKTKKLTKIAGVITLLACIWGGVSCEQNLPEETYTVTFESDGGLDVAAAKVNHGEKVTKPEDPTKDGYTFKGWFNGDTEYDFDTSVTANITLKAKWEVVVVNYKVTFDSDGGSEVAAVEVKDGEKVTKPADPTKTGYTFKGWLDGDKEYAFETAVTADITLKAKWEVVTYKITYELNGGTGDEGNPKEYTIETAEFTIKNPVSGPEATPNFAGWFSDKDLTKPAETTIKKGSTGDLSFYAKWSAKSIFTVTFKFVGVEESASVNVEEGKALTSAQLESVKSKISSDDYVFEDFYTNQECTTKFDVTKTFTANSTLYVKVNKIKKFTVKFDSAGGSVVEPAVVKDGAKVPKPADPTRTGYTFKGWLNGENVYNFETEAVTADITLEAKWEVVTYTVTFNSDGGSDVATVKVNHGAKVPKPADPTKPGYTFKGWLNGADVYNFETAVTANITLKAKWEIVTYTVTFDSDGGSEVAQAKVNHGAKVTKPEDPTKDGYAFKGWFNGDEEYVFETAVTANITLKAKWEGPLLPTTFKIGETYSGKVTYPMVENSGFGNATASDVIFNIDLSEQTLKTKDVVKLTFKVTESSSDAINSLGYQSQIDNWGWHSISVKELGSTYNLSFEVGETTEFEGNLVGIKLTPQDSDGSLIGKDLVIKIEDLSVTLVPYVEGAEKDFWTADTAEGYDFGLGCDYSKGIGIDASSLQAGNILTFYYTLTKVENEWGVYSQLKLGAGYSAKVLPSATDVGANEYGQINVSGTSFSYELTEADITAFAAESEDYKRLMVFGHNVILTKITVK